MNEIISKTLEQIEEAEKSLSESQSWIINAKAKRQKTGEYADPTDFANNQNNVRNQTRLIHSLNRKIKLILNDKEEIINIVKERFGEEASKELKKYVN